MRSLYLRIWLTVVVALGLYAAVSVWLMQRHMDQRMDQERQRAEAAMQGRAEAWAELLSKALPGAQAPASEQRAALQDWSTRLRLPMALDDAKGVRIAASDSFERREAEGVGPRRMIPMALQDGRTLTVLRGPGLRRGEPGEGRRPPGLPERGIDFFPGVPDGWGLAALLALMFAAVAAGAWPVVRHLTRRLEMLKVGMQTFGGGALHHRVDVQGQDEVAAVAASFNEAAARIENLVRSHQSLLANASHELRSPLARLKMAVSMWDDVPLPQRTQLVQEIHKNIAELDALVEEVLLASRLDSAGEALHKETVELHVLAQEEGARVNARVVGPRLSLPADERLLRRALRNLLENAQRYGEGDIVLQWNAPERGLVQIQVCDRGPGVPQAYRQRIFEAFFRLPGHAEREGGVGLGLSLVRQIAQRHGGQVDCGPREGGGSCFTLSLPV